MNPRLTTRLILVGALMIFPLVVQAQEAVLSGTVTDATGAVLPGVTVRAIHEASGNSFEAVTDPRGAYRIPVRIGVYKVTAELSSFKPVTREGVELLVGQTATINMQMSPGGVTESLTVTAQAPLIETATSSLGASIDPRQVSELPSGAQLDVARLAGTWKPDQRSGRYACTRPSRRPRVPAQCRRDAGDVEPWHRQSVAI